MQSPASISERISRTRAQQARALGGAGQAPARKLREVNPQSTAAPVQARPLRAANDEQTAAPLACMAPEGLANEFEALLPAVSKLYGYAASDVTFLRQALLGDRAGAAAELEMVVRQWRIDAVTAGLDLGSDDPHGLMPPGVAQRARLQFRMSVMREVADESGRPIAHDALDWSPELTYHAVQERRDDEPEQASALSPMEPPVKSAPVVEKLSARAKLARKARP